jgi:hypothetical protein
MRILLTKLDIQILSALMSVLLGGLKNHNADAVRWFAYRKFGTLCGESEARKKRIAFVQRKLIYEHNTSPALLIAIFLFGFLGLVYGISWLPTFLETGDPLPSFYIAPLLVALILCMVSLSCFWGDGHLQQIAEWRRRALEFEREAANVRDELFATVITLERVKERGECLKSVRFVFASLSVHRERWRHWPFPLIMYCSAEKNFDLMVEGDIASYVFEEFPSLLERARSVVKFLNGE